MPKPGKSESREDFISRCIGSLVGDEGYDKEQAAAICYRKWEDKDKEDGCEEEEDKAVWTGAYVSSLPDSAFLFVEEGESRDGKRFPLSKRHFPYKDASGKIDVAHLRNAIARIPQSNAPGLTPEKKRALQERARKLLAEQSKSLIDRISNLLKGLVGLPTDVDDTEGNDGEAVIPEGNGEDALPKGNEIAPEETNGSPARLPEESKEGLSLPRFMVWKAGETWRWLAVFTNRYRDRDNPPEILTDAAHRDFEKAVDSGEWPMPELWPWHVPHRIGVSDRVAYDDRGFMLATGVFDDKQYAEYLSTRKDLGVSHGMPTKEIRRDKDDSTLIIRYRSREISVLPMDNAANPFTGFLTMEGRDMGLSKDKEEFLRGLVGEEKWPSVEAMLSDKSKEVEGVEYKGEVTDSDAVTTTTTEPSSTFVTTTEVPVVVTPEPEVKSGPPPLTREEVADELGAVQIALDKMQDAFVGQFGRIVDEVAALKATVKSLQDAEAERQKENDSLTPAASLHEMVRSRVIGSPETRVKGKDPLLTAGPKMSEPAKEGPTPVPLINALMGTRQ